MKRNIFRTSAALIICCLALMLTPILNGGDETAYADATLKVGDAAPSVAVSRWVKGDGFTACPKGSIVVVEFWATWCPPCRESIPHLTSLQKKYARQKVVIAGVASFEKDNDSIDNFVQKMGEKIGYQIALDDDRRTAGAWFNAAGRKGIPSTFVVDRTGKIAYIGPPSGVDAVLEKLADRKD